MCTIQSKLSILVKVTLSAIATTIMMTMMRIMWRPTRHVTTPIVEQGHRRRRYGVVDR